MSFRAGGLMSGLDTNSIIEQFVALERVPIKNLQKQQDYLTAQKDLFGSIEKSMSALKTSMEDMDSITKLLSYSASSSNEDVMTVTADGEGVAGNHSIQLLQTAQAEQDRSVAFAAGSDEVKAGTLSIEVQGEDPVDVEIHQGYSLADLAYAINRSGAEVSATVIDTGTEKYLTVYDLKSGFESGTSADDALVLTETYTGSSGSELGLTQTIQAQNARMVFDGLSIERQENTISDVIPGVTFQLLDATDQPTVELSVEPNREGLKENVKKFVDSYNEVISFLDSQFKVGADDRAGILFGDGTLRSLMVRLQSAVSEGVNDAGGNFSTLRAVGIKTNSTGSLVIDDSDFDDAMADDFRGIAPLFTNENTGLFGRMSDLVDEYTDSIDGIFKYRKKGIDDRFNNLSDQIDRLELRVEAFEKRLVSQFTHMESVLGQLQSQQAYLTSAMGKGG